jgi:hypothetical protein
MFTKIREEGFEKFGDVSNDMSLKEDNRKRLIERCVNFEIVKLCWGSLVTVNAGKDSDGGMTVASSSTSAFFRPSLLWLTKLQQRGFGRKQYVVNAVVRRTSR